MDKHIPKILVIASIVIVGLATMDAVADTQKPCLLHERDIAQIRAGNLDWVKTEANKDYDGSKRYRCIDNNRTGASMIHYSIYHQHKAIFEWLVANTSHGWNTPTKPWPASMNDPVTSTCEIATTIKNNAYGSLEHIVNLKAHFLKEFGYQIRDIDGTEEAGKRAKFELAEDIFELACGANVTIEPPAPPVAPECPATDYKFVDVNSTPLGAWHLAEFIIDTIAFRGAKSPYIRFYCEATEGKKCTDLHVFEGDWDDAGVARDLCKSGQVALDLSAGEVKRLFPRDLFDLDATPVGTSCKVISDAPFRFEIVHKK